VGEEAKSYNREKTWPSINHSILCGFASTQKVYDDIESRLLSLLAGAGCSGTPRTKSWRRDGGRIAYYTRVSGHVTPPGQNRNENS
jgi:hypothetical protein